MKTVTIVAMPLALMAAPVEWVAGEESQRTFRSPVVMELFQSQGCSDCSPTQEYLNRSSERSDVLALSYGATYWDYLGWKDSFASPQFTQRQRGYSIRNHGVGVATPQYWINGQVTVLGTNPVRVAQLVDLGGPVGGPSVSIAGSTLNIGSGSAPPGSANIWLVYFDHGTIPVAISSVNSSSLAAGVGSGPYGERFIYGMTPPSRACSLTPYRKRVLTNMEDLQYRQT
jgi:hypothetical protein